MSMIAWEIMLLFSAFVGSLVTLAGIGVYYLIRWMRGRRK